jgi:hypothetical protein
MVLFISFIVNSCYENNNSTTKSTNKTGTYTEKADLIELINKIGDRDLKLIELIKNNPVSKLKSASLQKTNLGSSEFYFDTDNIMALKNDTNQAVYIIPAYKSSNVRDSNIYSISININDDFIDTKLNILQLNEDGTQEYMSRNFEYNTINSKINSKTSKINDLECYCTVYVTGGISQGTGWDFDLVIEMQCSSCSGSLSSGGSSSNPGFGTSTGSNVGSNTVISTVWASGGGSGYGYGYGYTGTQVYIGLIKKYNPDYVFSALQKFTITNSPEITGSLLDFLNTDGNTQSNKDFVVSIINAIEEGTVTNYQEASVLLNTYKYIKYNRTASDIDTGDVDNNSIGGYDNTLYSDFNPQQSPWPNVSSIIPVSQFIGFGAEGIRRNCMDYAKAQIAKMGYKISNYQDIGQTLKIYNEQTGVNQTELSKGLSYLKYAISKGIPVIVGVDDAPGVPLNNNGTPGNPDLTTDHFIVIVGMDTNNQGNYFQFYDNASGYPSQGANSLNLLYYNHSTGTISGQSQTSYAQSPGLHKYIITQIRKSKLL